MRFVEPEMGGILVKNNEHTNAILMERFGKDSLMALATVDHGIPSVRTVNAVYIDSAFYVVTYALSAKMQQIAKNPTVAVCGEWFTAHGVVENQGMFCEKKTRRSWTYSAQPLLHGMTMDISMKGTPTPVC